MNLPISCLEHETTFDAPKDGRRALVAGRREVDLLGLERPENVADHLGGLGLTDDVIRKRWGRVEGDAESTGVRNFVFAYNLICVVQLDDYR